MKTKMFNVLYKKDGSALMVVLLSFVVIMIFLGSIIMLFKNNLVQTMTQEKSVQAYYLALSGIDLGVSALLQEGAGGENDTLLYKEFSKDMKPNLNNTPTLRHTIDLGDGEVEITIRGMDIDGERWVEVHSIGILKDTSFRRSTNLQFLVSNPSVQKREQNRP